MQQCALRVLPRLLASCSSRASSSVAATRGKAQQQSSAIFSSVRTARNASGDWSILLDDRPLLSPSSRQPLTARSEALALAVAAEWRTHGRGPPRAHNMPLTSLCVTAQEQTQSDRLQVHDTLVSRFFETGDAAAVREDESTPLRRMQDKALDPIVDAVERHLIHGSGRIMVSSGGVLGARQQTLVSMRVMQILGGLSAERSAAFASIAVACRSVLLGLAGVHGFVGVEELLHAARLEESWQEQEWGRVEGGHDLDEAHIKVQVHAAISFLELSDAVWER